MEKKASDGPKWVQENIFPTNPDLADILGRTDLNFENFVFFVVLIFSASPQPASATAIEILAVDSVYRCRNLAEF